MTDETEAVAMAIVKGTSDPYQQAKRAITALDKLRIECAGEVEKKCAALAVQIDPLLLGGPDARLLNQAAATIASLRAEIERAKLDGVRAGIEASAGVAVEGRTYWYGKCADAKDRCERRESRDYETMAIACVHVEHTIRALDAEAIAKGESA